MQGRSIARYMCPLLDARSKSKGLKKGKLDPSKDETVHVASQKNKRRDRDIRRMEDGIHAL